MTDSAQYRRVIRAKRMMSGTAPVDTMAPDIVATFAMAPDIVATFAMAHPDRWAQLLRVNSESRYSMGILAYANRWATLLDGELKRGAALASVHASTASQADTDAVSGAMHYAAVGVLEECWEHGPALAKVVRDELAKQRQPRKHRKRR